MPKIYVLSQSELDNLDKLVELESNTVEFNLFYPHVQTKVMDIYRKIMRNNSCLVRLKGVCLQGNTNVYKYWVMSDHIAKCELLKEQLENL